MAKEVSESKALESRPPDQKITELIKARGASGGKWFSVEVTPWYGPEEEMELSSLLKRFTDLGPLFVDIASSSSLKSFQEEFACKERARLGCTINYHVSANRSRVVIEHNLMAVHKAGIRNLTVFDPPVLKSEWVPRCFESGVELVKFIRDRWGDDFCITVAGYPAGRPDSFVAVDLSELSETEKKRDQKAEGESAKHWACPDQVFEAELASLKAKVDAGAQLVASTLFLDMAVFTTFVERCRGAGIMVPIYPSLICFDTFDAFDEITREWHTRMPEDMQKAAREAKSDMKFRRWSRDICIKMGMRLAELGYTGLHLDALDSQYVPLNTLVGLGHVSEAQAQRCAKERADSRAQAGRIKRKTVQEENLREEERSPMDSDFYRLIRLVKKQQNRSQPMVLVRRQPRPEAIMAE